MDGVQEAIMRVQEAIAITGVQLRAYVSWPVYALLLFFLTTLPLSLVRIIVK